MNAPRARTGIGAGALLALAALGWWLWRRRSSGATTVKEGGTVDASNKLAWPVRGRISSPFGQRAAPTAGASTAHNGIDLAVPVGTMVRAPADGVVLARWNDLSYGGGYSLRLDHGGGLVTGFAHLSGWLVAVGERVARGQPIAYSGGQPGQPGAGTSTGPHLHLTLRVGGTAVDPVPYLES